MVKPTKSADMFTTRRLGPSTSIQKAIRSAMSASSHCVRIVVHASEEDSAGYVRQALDVLHSWRIDHSVRWLEVLEFAERIVRGRNPLTIRPLHNAQLKVFQDTAPRISKIMEMRSLVTVNSDNPAYCGGCVNENYRGLAEAWDLTADAQVTLARNSFLASFFGNATNAELVARVDAYPVRGKERSIAGEPRKVML